MARKTLPDIRPGEVRLDKLLTQMCISQNALACAVGMRISEIVLGKRGIPAARTVGLTAAMGTSERLRHRLQADFDLEQAHRTPGESVDQFERVAV